ncbi:MAG TPA: peptidoglycan-binding protein [Bryobacteraceae bacterium]|nr:peptidoglycan-binding protein [Bryobacteraceae bacterium]
MAANYIVAQGDYLSRIAKNFGFSDYRTIWNHPNNASLKAKRNPNVLYPGDSLYIPDRQPGEVTRPTDQTHKFQTKGVPLKLHLVLEDLYERPIANAKCTLLLGGDTRQVTSDGNGNINEPISPGVHEVTLIIQNGDTPYLGDQICIRVGDLDPVEEATGQAARLNNLGYAAGDISDADPSAFQSAVEEFQCDRGLTVDGICGPKTQAELKTAHGC